MLFYCVALPCLLCWLNCCWFCLLDYVNSVARIYVCSLLLFGLYCGFIVFWVCVFGYVVFFAGLVVGYDAFCLLLYCLLF